MEPIIRIENVSKSFQTKEGIVDAAKNLNLTIEKGDIYGIIGLSGAGKSTLVRCLNLLERPTEGKIYVNNLDLGALSQKELRLARREIGMIFQHFNLLMQRTVLDNVTFPLEIAGVGKKEARERARELLKTVGLEDKEKAYPVQLSGGQKQRVAIARVLANNPAILLCDEATSALDPQTTKSILTLLKEINLSLGITIVVITHEMAVVQEICNKVAVLEKGEIVESGTVAELFCAPKTHAAKKLIYAENVLEQSIADDRNIRIVFDNQSSYEPVIANLILQYKAPINILHADTRNIQGKAVGEMILQLPEQENIAAQMIASLRAQNIKVEEWKKDVG